MDMNSILETAETLLAPWILESKRKSDSWLDVYLPSEKIVDVVAALVNTGIWRLSAISGVDIPQIEGGEGQIELIYHFFHKSLILNARIAVPYSNPVAPSICGVIPSAVLHEREAMELLGVNLEGIPMRERLLLSDDWPEGVYPLRKSFTRFD